MKQIKREALNCIPDPDWRVASRPSAHSPRHSHLTNAESYLPYVQVLRPWKKHDIIIIHYIDVRGLVLLVERQAYDNEY